ncbi:hypothetical protein [Aerococcus urinaeequi]|uniref:hypothetical protein n=1 Tax=Aerococcus urinaeequi TaxID=51665 RepID=UPI003D6B9419
MDVNKLQSLEQCIENQKTNTELLDMVISELDRPILNVKKDRTNDNMLVVGHYATQNFEKMIYLISAAFEENKKMKELINVLMEDV